MSAGPPVTPDGTVWPPSVYEKSGVCGPVGSGAPNGWLRRSIADIAYGVPVAEAPRLKTCVQLLPPSVDSHTRLPASSRWSAEAGSMENGLTNWAVSDGFVTAVQVCPPSV